VGYACAGIAVDVANVIVRTAPIFKWMVGNTLDDAKLWVFNKNGSMRQII